MFETQGGLYGIIRCKKFEKVYTTRLGSNQVQALSNVNFSVEQGEYVAIMGESGSGKTTLLNILASLDRPTGGEVILNGKNTVDIKEKELSAFRRKNLGFVFQDFNLLDTFSLQDNIFLPLVLSGEKYDSMQEKLKPIAKELGIESILGSSHMRCQVDRSRGQRLRELLLLTLRLFWQMSPQERWIQSLQTSF